MGRGEGERASEIIADKAAYNSEGTDSQYRQYHHKSRGGGAGERAKDDLSQPNFPHAQAGLPASAACR